MLWPPLLWLADDAGDDATAAAVSCGHRTTVTEAGAGNASDSGDRMTRPASASARVWPMHWAWYHDAAEALVVFGICY